MISLELAQRLRDAGLPWYPAERDSFALPDRQMDTHVFTVSELTALIQLYNGHPVVTFHGSTEWALDYVFLTDTIWIPSETQLREQIVHFINPDAPLRLERITEGYHCLVGYGDRVLEFTAETGETAYALALLHMLEHQQSKERAE